MLLPTCIVDLIMSFVPGPEPYEPKTMYFSLDTMRTEDWADVEDVRAYGDY